MGPRQELYSNSGMNSRLEQPAVRKSVREGALFVYPYIPDFPYKAWGALPREPLSWHG